MLLLVVSLSVVPMFSLPLTRPHPTLQSTSSEAPMAASPSPREDPVTSSLPNQATSRPFGEMETGKPSTAEPEQDSSPTATSSRSATTTIPPAPTVEDYQLFTQLTREIITKSLETSQSAGFLVGYFVVYLDVNTSHPASVCSCFIEERDPEVYKHSPDTDFVQLIVEDYISTDGYISYIEWIVEDGSLPTGNGSYTYRDQFANLQRLLGELRDDLGKLIEMVGGDRPSEGREGEGSGMELMTDDYPDCCHVTSYSRQYWTFNELSTLFTQFYIPEDIDYLRKVTEEQKN